jgi:hypothetical protein
MPNTKDYRTVLPRVLAQSAVAVSKTGDTTETTLATITIPGGSMGPNGSVRVTTLWSCTNSANTKTLRGKFGGTVYLTRAETATANIRHQFQVQNRGSAASQVGATGNLSTGWGISTSPLVTSSVDTAADQVITLTAQLAVGTETITLEAYLVELVPS